MEFHWGKHLVFKYGVDDIFLLVPLHWSDVVFGDGIKGGFILGLFIVYEVVFKDSINFVDGLVIIFGYKDGIKYGFLLGLMLRSNVEVEYVIEDLLLLGVFIWFEYGN